METVKRLWPFPTKAQREWQERNALLRAALENAKRKQRLRDARCLLTRDRFPALIYPI